MFLTTLNGGLHPSLTFTMELPVNGRIPFFGIEIIKNGTELETQVHRRSANTGLLLHFPSHNDKRYKDCIKDKLPSIFSRLDYPRSIADSVISNFESRNLSVSIAERNTYESNIVRSELVYPFQSPRFECT